MVSTSVIIEDTFPNSPLRRPSQMAYCLCCLLPHTLGVPTALCQDPAERQVGRASPAPLPLIWPLRCPAGRHTYTFPDSCSISSHCVCSNSDSAANKTFPCGEKEPE